MFVEAAFARWPERATRCWRRPAVRAGAPLALVAGTLCVGERGDGGTPFVATLGGLAGYFALLIGIVSGVVPEPARWFR